MANEDIPHSGLAIRRMIDGELVRLDRMDADITARCEMLGKLNDRWLEYRSARDGQGLLKLSEEYSEKNMKTLAAMIRQEAHQYGAAETTPNSPVVPDTRGQWGGHRKTKGSVSKTSSGDDMGAVGLSGRRPARNAGKGKANAK